MSLKKTISTFSSQDVTQCAKMGKQIILLQHEVDKHKSMKVHKEREMSFTRTIGMHKR